jgi:Zn-dependent protease with chaperone function
MRRLRRIACLGVAAALLAAGGCATNQITGRRQLLMVPEETAVSQSAAAYTQMMGQLGAKRQIESGTARAQKVQEITDRLIEQAIKLRPASAGWKWEVHVIMAGGKMAIYSGMWEKLKITDEEIAQVMGHEISHALADHTRERMSVAYGTSGAVNIAAIALGAGDQAAKLMQQAAVYAIQLPNSRESEAEADQIGIELAARAGYDPHAAVTLWQKMGQLGGTPPEFLSTHPSPQHREAALRELGAKVQPLYAAARADPAPRRRYVNAGEGEASSR